MATIQSLSGQDVPPEDLPSVAPQGGSLSGQSVPTGDLPGGVTAQGDVQQPETFVGALKSLLYGAGRGILESPGIISDLGDIEKKGIGKVLGNQSLVDSANAGLRGESGFGTNVIAKYLNDAGILQYQPTTGTDQTIYNVGHFAGPSVVMGAPKAIYSAATEGIPAGIAALVRYFGAGVGGGGGSEVGRHVANATLGEHDDSPWTRFALETGGALLGGGMAGATMNRNFGEVAAPITKDFADLGVKPRFASDINPKPGLLGRFTSETLPDRFGAQGVSSTSAETTQNEISKAANAALEPDWMGNLSIQRQGEAIQGKAIQAAADLRTETSTAFKKLDSLIPPTSQVATTDTTQAIGNLVNRASDPDIKAIVSNPTFTKYAALINKPNLSWNDMQILRSEIGASMDGAEGTELGLLKQIYKGVTSDMQRTAQATPGAGAAFNDAMSTAEKNGEFTRGILKDLINKPSPENLPGYLTQQGSKGATRLQGLFDAAPGLSDADKASIGKAFLGNQARGADGQFDLDKLMQYWNTASPEMRAAMTQDPALQQTMGQIERVYGATKDSRGLIDAKPPFDPLVFTGASPLLSNLTARVAQTPFMAGRLGRQLGPNAITPRENMGMTAAAVPANVFPDIYRPPPQPQHDQPPAGASSGQTQSWLMDTDRPSAKAYIVRQLGPAVGAQVPDDDTGFKAAMSQLFSQPQYRKAIASGTATQE